MPIRTLLLMLVCTLSLAFGMAVGASGAEIRATGFGSSGITMGTWRWLNNDRGTGYISWVFDSQRIVTDDLKVHFEGLAAFPPGSPGTIRLRVHYGFPGTTQAGGVYAETQLMLRVASGQTGVVGVPVEGDLTITAAMMDAVAPDARRLSIRIEQSENPGVSVAFQQQSATLTPVAPGEDELPGTGASDFDSNGDYIQTWYWLRDSALAHYATWRIDDVPLVAGGLALEITALATTRVNGPRGIDARFRLRYGTSASVLEGRGGYVLSLHLPNISPPSDPVGYTNRDVIVLPTSRLGGTGRTVTLYLRVERESAGGPHVAFNEASMRVLQEGEDDLGGLTDDGEDGDTDNGTEDTDENGDDEDGGGTALAIEVTDGGRTLTSTVPFLVPADQVGAAIDADGDGVLQAFEDLAMARLNPIVELDEDESWLADQGSDNVVNFVSIAPYPSLRVPRYLLVIYATTWSRDYGRDTMPGVVPGADLWNEYIAKRHNGDIEKLVEAWEVTGPNRAELRYVYTSAHDGPTLHSAVWNATGRSCNEGRVIALPPRQTICATLQFENGRVKVMASQNKHAYYPTATACEDVRLFIDSFGTGIGEDCGQGPTLSFPAYNIGEKGDLLLESIDFLFAGETLTEDFCGGSSPTYFSTLPCVGTVEAAIDGPPNLLVPVLLHTPLALPYGTAEMYEHANFHGFSMGLTTNSEIADLSHMWGGTTDVNDMISSLKLGPGISCRFYQHANYTGTVIGPVTSDDATNGEWPDLSVYGMNDEISSVRCEAAP